MGAERVKSVMIFAKGKSFLAVIEKLSIPTTGFSGGYFAAVTD
jgi:hypothetical protein